MYYFITNPDWIIHSTGPDYHETRAESTRGPPEGGRPEPELTSPALWGMVEWPMNLPPDQTPDLYALMENFPADSPAWSLVDAFDAVTNGI